MNHDQIEKAKAYLKTQYESLNEIKCLDDSTKKILTDLFNFLRESESEMWKKAEDYGYPHTGMKVLVYASGRKRISEFRSRQEWASQRVTHWRYLPSDPDFPRPEPRPPQGVVEHDVSFDEATVPSQEQVYRFAVTGRSDNGFVPLPFVPENNPPNVRPTTREEDRALYRRMREQYDRALAGHPFRLDNPVEAEPLNTETAHYASDDNRPMPTSIAEGLNVRPGTTWVEWMAANERMARRPE